MAYVNNMVMMNRQSSTTSSLPLVPFLAPRLAHSSLKQARLLFDCDVGATSNGNDGRAGDLLATTQAFMPPLYDRNATLHKPNIERKIQLLHPGETEKLAFHYMVAV